MIEALWTLLTWWFYGCLAALALMFFTLSPMPGARDDVTGCGGTLMLGAILGLVLWSAFGGEGDSKTTASERENAPQHSTQKAEEGFSPNNPEQEGVPQYTVKKAAKGIWHGQPVAAFNVNTRARSEEDLRAIVKDLRTKTPDQDGQAVFFRTRGSKLFAGGYAFADAETEAVFMESIEAEPAQWQEGKDGSTTVLLP